MINASDRYDDMSASYDVDRVQGYLSYVRDFVAQWIGNSPRRVVEIGSGTGEYSLTLAQNGHTVWGLDVSSNMVDLSREKAGNMGIDCSFLVADAQIEIPVPGPVDSILSIDSWECFPRPSDILSVAREAISNDGNMLIVTPDNLLFPIIWLAETLRIKKNRPAFEHHNSFTFKIRSLSHAAGFTVQSIQRIYYGTTLAITLEPR